MPKPKVILIIEDDESIGTVLLEKFKKEEFHVEFAQDGFAGLELALNTHPDIILLDILMPKMSGLATLRSLRKDSWGSQVPVIILSNVSSEKEEVIKSVAKDKPSYYMVKSDVTLDQIVGKVKELMVV